MRKNIAKRLPIEQIQQTLNKMGLELYNYDESQAICDKKFSVRDYNGYYYKVYWSAISKGFFPMKFYKSNPYTIQNINHFLTLERNGEYVCISKTYNGNTEPLEFVHLPCMKKFISNLAAIQGKQSRNGEKYYKQCPYCQTFLLESRHASVLKQIFIHEYPDTTTEDRSCVNPKTKRCLPTDIVNHRLKIAIEIQSDFHDTEDKRKIDAYKKNYWIKKGYDFYSPDIRDYKILELIQLFFPNIDKIPTYINYDYSTPTNPKEVQKLLNEGNTIKETSIELDIAIHIIHNMIASGSVFLPEECKRKAMNAKTLVHLSKKGEYIKEYDHLNDVSKDGFALGTIQRVLKGTQKFAYDSYWVYGEKYYNNDFTIPTEDPDRYLIPIYSFKDNQYCYYPNVYEAAEIIGCHPCEIYDVLKGRRKSFRKYKFYTTNEIN